MTRAAQKLLALMLLDVQRLMRALESGAESVAQWQQQFRDYLARYHAAALLVGQGSTQLSDPARKWLGETVAAQIKYLHNFAVEIQDADTFRAGWNARAALYALGIKQSYWKGETKFLPLPAMPADGTSQCLSNCHCAWEIEELEGEGNADAYWRIGAAEHCQTCVQRSADWAPYKIRNGEAA